MKLKMTLVAFCNATLFFVRFFLDKKIGLTIACNNINPTYMKLKATIRS